METIILNDIEKDIIYSSEGNKFIQLYRGCITGKDLSLNDMIAALKREDPMFLMAPKDSRLVSGPLVLSEILFCFTEDKMNLLDIDGTERFGNVASLLINTRDIRLLRNYLNISLHFRDADTHGRYAKDIDWKEWNRHVKILIDMLDHCLYMLSEHENLCLQAKS